MPKAKPDQVIVHRIELQETERATLEAALAGRFVTNVAMAGGNLLNGVGAALAPLSGVFQAIAVLWIADRTAEEIIEAVKETKEGAELLYNSAQQAAGTYGDTVAWLNVNYANSGFDKIPTTHIYQELTKEQQDAWFEFRDELANNWGPYDSHMLFKIIAKAMKWGMADGYTSQKTGTPGEWLTREMSIMEWVAWQTQFNAKRNK